jgi:hypothetical protein
MNEIKQRRKTKKRGESVELGAIVTNTSLSEWALSVCIISQQILGRGHFLCSYFLDAPMSYKNTCSREEN